VLETATALIWGYGVNIQLYRQLTIGVTDKHVQDVHQPFNRFDDQGPDADLNVAFAWQSGHRPIARATNYGLDGAFPTQLQPSLLRAYEWVSARWHEFLRQGSKSASQPSSDKGTTRLGQASDELCQRSPQVSLVQELRQQVTPPRSSPTLPIVLSPSETTSLPPSRPINRPQRKRPTPPEVSAQLPSTQPKRRKRANSPETSTQLRSAQPLRQRGRSLHDRSSPNPLSHMHHNPCPNSPLGPLDPNDATTYRLPEPQSAIDWDDPVAMEALDTKILVPHQIERFRGLLTYWEGVRCHLCMSYGWSSLVYDHTLEDCPRKEACEVLQILHVLRNMPQWGDPDSRTHCQWCFLPKVFCLRTWYLQDIVCQDTLQEAFEQKPMPHNKQGCYFDDVMLRVIAVLLKAHDGYFATDGVLQVVKSCGEARAEEEVQKWLAKPMKIFTLPVPRMVRVFNTMARQYERFAYRKRILFPFFRGETIDVPYHTDTIQK
jgi:hypothetical protein